MRTLTELLILFLIVLLPVAAETDAPGHYIWIPEEVLNEEDALWQYVIGYVRISYDRWEEPVAVHSQPDAHSDTLFTSKSFKDAIAEGKIQLVAMYGYNSSQSLKNLQQASRFTLSNLCAEVPVLKFRQVNGGFWIEILYDMVNKSCGWINVSPRWIFLFESDDIQGSFVFPLELLTQDTTALDFYDRPDGDLIKGEVIRSRGKRYPHPSPYLCVLDVKGDWMRVTRSPLCDESKGSLWIRWRNEGKILILLIQIDIC